MAEEDEIITRDKLIILSDSPEFQRAQAAREKPYTDEPQPFYDTLPKMIEDFNRFFIQALIGNQPSVIWEHDDKFTIFSYEQFHKQFSYVRIVNGNDKGPKPTKIWLDSYNKRRVPGIKLWPSTVAVDPEDPENKFFNIWRGWATKPIKDTVKCRFILRYVYGICCNKDRPKANQLLDFYAHLLQRPEQKPAFGIAIRGEEEGTGKSTLINEMKKIVGKDNSFSTADPEEIFGTNNPGMNGCMLLHLEEVEWAKYNRYANKLRNLFTTPTVNITDKYEKQFEQNNFTRIAISGNAEHIMQISRTGRRLTVMDINPEHASDTKYFAALAWVFNNGGREALMYYLLHRDISNFDPFKPLHTKEMDDQKELSLNAVAEFWLEEYLEKNVLPYDEALRGIDGTIVQYKVIVEKLAWCFNDWQRSRGERTQFSAKAFGRQFRKIVPEMRPAHDVKIQPGWLGRQLNCFELPNLKKCREYFVTYQGWKHKIWNNAEQFDQTYVDKSLWFRER